MRQVTVSFVALVLGAAMTECGGRVEAPNPPVSTTGLTARQQYLSVGQDHACGILTSGAVSCWSLLKQVPTPTMAPPMRFVDVSVGSRFACGVDTNAAATCWSLDGENAAPSPPGGQFRSARVGEGWACGISSDWSIACWGNLVGIEFPAGRFVDIATGDGFLCAIRANGTILCVSKLPLITSDMPSGEFSRLTSSKWQVCALRIDGTPFCWGEAQEVSRYPLQSPVSVVAAGTEARCALTTQGEPFCWGNMSRWGAIVPTGYPNVGLMFPFPPGELFVDLHLGYLLSGLCATRRDGTVVCQRGLNTMIVPGAFVSPT